MTTLFSDGFESGDLTGWSASDISVATIAASTGSKKNGTYGAICDVNSTGSDTSFRACVFNNFVAPASNIIVAEAWVQMAAYTSAGYATGLSKGPLRIGNSGADDATERALGIIITNSGEWQGAYRSKNGNDATFGTAFAFVVGTWYRLRLVIDKTGANPIATWYTSTDGSTFTQQGTVTDATAGTNGMGAPISRVRAGIIHNGQFEKGLYTIYVDDVAVYDAVPVAATTAPPPSGPRMPFAILAR